MMKKKMKNNLTATKRQTVDMTAGTEGTWIHIIIWACLFVASWESVIILACNIFSKLHKFLPYPPIPWHGASFVTSRFYSGTTKNWRLNSWLLVLHGLSTSITTKDISMNTGIVTLRKKKKKTIEVAYVLKIVTYNTAGLKHVWRNGKISTMGERKWKTKGVISLSMHC